MTKKEYVMGIIESLQAHQDLLPNDLQTLLQEVKESLDRVSADSFFMESNHAVSQPAQYQPYQSDSPLFRLSEGYWEIKRLAEVNRESHPDMIRAADQLGGLLGASENYSPE
ncbi:hypothetical protein NDK47_09155 [Brevibacillus ruminantium]|uniref:Uncharacterized protein n=1 Tax=Brevibacillus ruminantium TaxID=2950604 RepID=A0ABY4WJY0_9BACL|nr:hypothetical protein [Brevibacillus ruminantium]USG67422.1 hypothetical protein NDK47_09155 [Brevibacillus ruminantium]